MSVVDGAVTPAKINAGGSSTGQVLISNGSSTPAWGYPDKLYVNGSAAMQVVPGSGTQTYPNIIGGTGNTVAEYGATVSGGYNNKAKKWGAAVGGGLNNQAKGVCAAIPGGYNNMATGEASFAIGTNNMAQGRNSIALGYQAYALHEGSFVLHDYTWFSTLYSSADNQFSARFTGGYRLYSNGGQYPADGSGVILAHGSGSWASASDRALKENFAAVSANEVLQKLAAVPVQTWNYKDQDDSVRHIGPVAQDFYAAFGVGDDDKHINTIDADGVALVSIQELYRLLQEKDDEIQANQAQLEDLQARLAALENAAAGH